NEIIRRLESAIFDSNPPNDVLFIDKRNAAAIDFYNSDELKTELNPRIEIAFVQLKTGRKEVSIVYHKSIPSPQEIIIPPENFLSILTNGYRVYDHNMNIVNLSPEDRIYIKNFILRWCTSFNKSIK